MQPYTGFLVCFDVPQPLYLTQKQVKWEACEYGRFQTKGHQHLFIRYLFGRDLKIHDDFFTDSLIVLCVLSLTTCNIEVIPVCESFKVKLSPKSDLGFICECLWVKHRCKSIITMKEAFLRFTIVSFSCKLIFNGVLGNSHDSIKIAIFKTLRGLDSTWNFAPSITRVSTQEHEHWEHCLCTQSLLKRRFLNNSC